MKKILKELLAVLLINPSESLETHPLPLRSSSVLYIILNMLDLFIKKQ